MIYKTKGRVRQRVATLARLAGLEKSPLVGFSRAELERLSPGCLEGSRTTTCSKRDTACGRGWRGRQLIWVSLPATDDTLAHEVNHLRTGTSHTTQAFNNAVVALTRGKDPRKAKPAWYEVTIVTKEVRRVWELSAYAAKQRYRTGSKLIPPVQTLTAKKQAKGR